MTPSTDTLKQKELNKICKYCQPKPNGVICVDDINHPVCSNCGKLLNFMKQKESWEEELGKIVIVEGFEGDKHVRPEALDEIIAVVRKTIHQTQQAEKIKTIKEIKYHFETMLFDNTGEDKTVNIMEFRKAQSKYLDDLLQKMESEK